MVLEPLLAHPAMRSAARTAVMVGLMAAILRPLASLQSPCDTAGFIAALDFRPGVAIPSVTQTWRPCRERKMASKAYDEKTVRLLAEGRVTPDPAGAEVF